MPGTRLVAFDEKTICVPSGENMMTWLVLSGSNVLGLLATSDAFEEAREIAPVVKFLT